MLRKVALKIIKPGMDTKQVIARFKAERQALMNDPSIAKVLDGGATESGPPSFVMELVRSIPITTYCDQACLSLDDRHDLFVVVCQAVQHSHENYSRLPTPTAGDLASSGPWIRHRHARASLTADQIRKLHAPRVSRGPIDALAKRNLNT
jgi:hypothetical protein